LAKRYKLAEKLYLIAGLFIAVSACLILFYVHARTL